MEPSDTIGLIISILTVAILLPLFICQLITIHRRHERYKLMRWWARIYEEETHD